MPDTKGRIRRRAPKSLADSLPGAPAKWRLRLYVAGNTANSIAAFANLKEICEKHLDGGYQIEVVDLLENPTLVRKLPYPVKRSAWKRSETTGP